MKNIFLVFICSLVGFLGSSQGTTNLSFKTNHYNSNATYLSNGKLIISDKNSIRLYNEGTEDLLNEYKSESSFITCLIKNELDEILVFGKSGGIEMLDENLVHLRSMSIKGKGIVLNAEFVHDSLVLVLSSKNFIIGFNPLKGSVAWEKRIVDEKVLRALAVNQSKGIVACGGASHSITILDALNGNEIRKINFDRKDWVRALAFDFDGEIIACGTDDNNVRIINWIRKLKFTEDDQYLVSVSDDETAVFYELKTKSVALRIEDVGRVPSDILISPGADNLYIPLDGEKNSSTFYVSSLNIVPRRKLSNEADNLAPQIYISNPANIVNERVSTSQSLFKLEGVVLDEEGVLELKINGLDVPFEKSGKFILYVPLTMGDNPIEIISKDVNGNTSMKRFTMARKNLSGEDYVSDSATNYLLVIGIDQYSNWPELNNAVSDAKKVGSILVGKYTFEPQNATFLFNEEATKEGIDSVLKSYIEKVTPVDNLLIYYAGHGDYDDLLNEGYWVPVNARTNKESDYYSNSRLLKIVKNINSQHTLLIVDACFSGALFAERSRGFVENVEKYKSRWGLASGRLETVSDGAKGGSSPFAESLITILDNSDVDLPVSEISLGLKKKVSEVSNQTPRGNPLKNVGDEGGEFILHKR